MQDNIYTTNNDKWDIFFRRISAGFIDFCLLIFLIASIGLTILPLISIGTFLILLAILYPLGDTGFLISIIGLGVLFILLALLLVFVVPMVRKGVNNGKQMMNLKVIKNGGQEIDFKTAFVREIFIKYCLLIIFSILTLGVVLVVKMLSILWNKSQQAFSDKFTNTLIIDSKVVEKFLHNFTNYSITPSATPKQL